jgi:hypothetical protein
MVKACSRRRTESGRPSRVPVADTRPPLRAAEADLPWLLYRERPCNGAACASCATLSARRRSTLSGRSATTSIEAATRRSPLTRQGTESDGWRGYEVRPSEQRLAKVRTIPPSLLLFQKQGPNVPHQTGRYLCQSCDQLRRIADHSGSLQRTWPHTYTNTGLGLKILAAAVQSRPGPPFFSATCPSWNFSTLSKWRRSAAACP